MRCCSLFAVAAAVPVRPARAQSTVPAFRTLISTGPSRSFAARSGPPALAGEYCAGIARAAYRVLPWHGRLTPGIQLSGPVLGQRGIASLHVQHVGSDTSLWQGNPLGVIERVQRAAHESEALSRAVDVRFALDRLLSSGTGPYGGQIDRRRIVAAGHSYGANTALIAVGARVMRDGRWVEARDPRFAAAIVISAPPFYGETICLGAEQDHDSDPARDRDRRRHPDSRILLACGRSARHLQRMATPRKLLAVFQGGSHSMFTDRHMTGGPTLNPKVKVATAELALAFLDLVFDSNATTLTRWNATWQPICAGARRRTFSRSDLAFANIVERSPIGIAASP